MWQTVFCDACQQTISPCLPPVCQRCGISLSGAFDAQLICARCQAHPLAFDQARAPFLYAGAVREAIHAFKYQGRHRIGPWLAASMSRLAQRECASAVDLVVPVPMHWLKARWRGTNPSAVLARLVAKALRRPIKPRLLRRRRWTASQTRLSRHQRFLNVREAFAADRTQAANRRILLVDDVLTSGATAHACALALREAGSCSVIVLTAACAALA